MTEGYISREVGTDFIKGAKDLASSRVGKLLISFGCQGGMGLALGLPLVLSGIGLIPGIVVGVGYTLLFGSLFYKMIKD